MFYTLILENEAGQKIGLSKTANRYMFSKIKGLDPPTGTISTSNYAGMNGSYLNNAFIEKRNIVITFQMRGFDVELRRHELYRVVKPSRYIKIYYSTKNISVYAEGIVETCEVENFEKLTNGQISILCPDIYWYSTETQIAEYSRVRGAFHFVCPDNDEPFPIGAYNTQDMMTINNSGDEVGFTLEISGGPAKNPTIYNALTDEYMQISGDIQKGDVITITTKTGNKTVLLEREGVVTNIINRLVSGSTWLNLKTGENKFYVTASEDAIANVPPDSKDYARNLLKTLYHKIFTEKLIRFTEIHDMNQDDALEMFVRFNSGGKALRKSEITMSILEAYWPSAKTEFGKLLVDSYEGYGSDFIIRAALMLYGDVVKSNINRKISEELKNNWSSFKKALKNLETVLKSLRIEVSRFSSSWNVLLPVLYYIYYNPENHVNNTEAIRAYLMRAILFTYFQSGTTSKLQQMKSNINSYDYEITVEMLDQITDLRVTDGKIEDILNAEKGSRVAGDALYYLCLEWTNKNFKYEQDHLHPYDRFDGNKPISVSMEDWRRWRGLRNRLPNLQLLEGRSNGSKNNMRLIDYYNDMNDAQKADFYKQAIIPEGVSLEIEHFEELYNKRKEMLAARIKALLG